MIAYLKGTISKKTEKAVILNTGNIGYLLHLSKTQLANVMQDEEYEFFIHSHIREDAFDLYGFTSYEQLGLFRLLISINGVGPKVALEILNIPENKIKSAIINEDTVFICQIPGIGKKTAQRITLELKGKIELDNLEKLEETQSFAPETQQEAIDALINLGYQRHEVRRTLTKLPEEIKEAEEIITFFLKNH